MSPNAPAAPVEESEVSPLLIFLIGHAQPGYEAEVLKIAQRWDDLPATSFEGATQADFSNRLANLLDRGAISDERKLQLIADLRTLSWWCGLDMPDAVCVRLALQVRRIYAAMLQQIARPAVPLAIRPSAHALFVGPLYGPLHSPSRGAIDYARALADDPAVTQVDLYHRGALRPEMAAYIGERLQGVEGRIRLFGGDDSQLLPLAITQGPYVHHFWCELALAPEISILSLFGPTVMFTCGDEAPLQFADLYWYLHEPAYVAAAWSRKGAPELFVRNYVETSGSPSNVSRPVEPLDRAEIGLTADQVSLVTVGNRLMSEFDQPFVDGMGALLRRHPAAHWTVIGALAPYLRDTLKAVLGSQLTHVPYENALRRRLTTADIFVNPFRRGGADSAMLAMLGGAIGLTRGDLGDMRAFVPPEHRAAVTAEAFFAQLDALVTEPALRRAWRERQARRVAQVVDEAAFTRTLTGLSDLAFERYRARAHDLTGPWANC